MKYLEKTAPTIEVKVYVSGDLSLIKHYVSEYVLDGFCISIAPIDYVYTMGVESGAVLTLINYPRFPSNEALLMGKGLVLAKFLIERLHQGSATIVGPKESVFISRRKQDQ